MGLVQWSQRHEIFQCCERLFIDEHRLRELCATVDDAMSGRANTVLTEHAIAAPGKKKLNCALMAEPSAGRPALFADDPSLRACNEVRLGQQTFELAPQQRCGGSSSRKTENFRLEEPAFKTRNASDIVTH